MQEGSIIWFNGLPGSGKSTLASIIEQRLRERGFRVENLDQETTRTLLGIGWDFQREEAELSTRKYVFLGNLLTRNGVTVLVATSHGYGETIERARQEIGRFVEVWLNCPLEVCRQRDQTGIYHRVEQKEIRGCPEIERPFTPSPRPEVILYPARETPEEGGARVIATLGQLGYIPSTAPEEETGYTPEEEEQVKKRLQDLGYL